MSGNSKSGNRYFTGHVKKQLANNWLLYDTIARELSISHVVDSSKGILRAKLLSTARPEDVFILLLIRDIEGVVASAVKRNGSPEQAARQWIQLYGQCYRILKNNKLKFKTISYKEMVASPEHTREKVCRFIGLPCPEEPLGLKK